MYLRDGVIGLGFALGLLFALGVPATEFGGDTITALGLPIAFAVGLMLGGLVFLTYEDMQARWRLLCEVVAGAGYGVVIGGELVGSIVDVPTEYGVVAIVVTGAIGAVGMVVGIREYDRRE